MKRPFAPVALVAVLFVLSFEGVARAQLRPTHPISAPIRRENSATPPRNLRSRLGAEIASRLMRSNDPDDRIRGIERATAIHTREGLALLVRAAASAGSGGLDPRLPVEGIARTDPKALLAVVRGLATWSNEDSARTALASILRDTLARESLVAPGGSSTRASPSAGDSSRTSSTIGRPFGADEREGALRVLLARRVAALALAGSGSSLAADALVATARVSGPGQQAAIEALALLPPSNGSLLSGPALTSPAMIALATSSGDLRVIDAIAGLTHSSDLALRAASIAALGATGDARDVGVARAAISDPDPRVRTAAASALVRLSALDGPAAVEALIDDDATVLDGLDLAQFVQSEGVTKAAAARAVAAADPAIRAGALTALGRQTAPAAVDALERLSVDPSIGGDAACALAHSPSSAALAALERLAMQPTTRRLAARAYFVRRYTRAERSASLDALLLDLAASSDPRDRAVGLQARVSLGETPIGKALDDPDATVRRAVAMAALASWSDGVRAALLARRRADPDPATRTVLGIGLLDGDPLGMVPSSALVHLARDGAADGPLAVMTLAARADDSPTRSIDVFLASPDPVIRAHAASGLARSAAPDAPGTLARMYGWEADAAVRRVIVEGLGARNDRDAPLSRDALDTAARLDPDPAVQWIAARALAHRPLGLRSVRREVAWIRLIPARDASIPRDETAMLVQNGGPALPIAFDAEGYALVPGVRSGESRVRLAPRVPTYSLSIP